MRIFYFAPDNNKPSWGLGVIYHHVEILNRSGYNSLIVHNETNFKVKWLDINVPTLSIDFLEVFHDDILVIPEVMAFSYDFRKYNCKKILFVQATALLFHDNKYSLSHKQMGFQKAIVIMPHMLEIVPRFTGLAVNIIPPFIADYFFKKHSKLHERDNIILIFPKFHLVEYNTIKNILWSTGLVFPNTFENRLFKSRWRLIELQGLSHIETAEWMCRASFIVTLNSCEAFNTSVPEAMAAGCVNLCYEAFGPVDYLENNSNAFVFNNNDFVSLLDKLLALISQFDEYNTELITIRNNARLTAEKYSKKFLETPLDEFYQVISN